MTRPKNELIRMARRVRLIIRVIALLLVAFFSFLKLRGIPVGPAIASLPARSIIQVSLALYFASWVFGTLNDTNVQEEAYGAPPEQGQIPWSAFLIIAPLGIGFGVLCYVETPRQFALSLLAFLLVNLLGWQYLVKRLLIQSYRVSRSRYVEEGDLIALLFLEFVWEYISGRWQWWRFGLGLTMSGILVILAFSSLPLTLVGWMRLESPELLVSLFILLFVVSFEGWVWAQRLRLRVAKEVFAELPEGFAITSIEPRESTTDA